MREPIVQIDFAVSGDDAWLRGQIRGAVVTMPRIQTVIVQGFDEARRVVAAMARLKHALGKPYGGCQEQMIGETL